MDGLDRAESVCLWLDIPFERKANVLIIDKGSVCLRIGFYDGHFLVYIGVHPQNQHSDINWVGFDPMLERDLVKFLKNTLPQAPESEQPQPADSNS
ncbi:MAG: hypothetical protein AAF708_07740 [Deinococcota bacterium]